MISKKILGCKQSCDCRSYVEGFLTWISKVLISTSSIHWYTLNLLNGKEEDNFENKAKTLAIEVRIITWIACCIILWKKQSKSLGMKILFLWSYLIFGIYIKRQSVMNSMFRIIEKPINKR